MSTHTTNPSQTDRRVEWAVWCVMGLTVAAIAWAYATRVRGGGSKQLAEKLPVISQVQDFRLTNQLNQAVGLSTLAGKVWVANVIFTRCPGPCVGMTRTMTKIREEASLGDQVRWISLSADPEFDTPSVFAAYARKWGAESSDRWFLTGAKDVIRRLAIDDLKLVVVEKDAYQRTSEEDLFLHSTRFILVDRRGWVRGVYEGTEKAARDLLLHDLRLLVSSPDL